MLNLILSLFLSHNFCRVQDVVADEELLLLPPRPLAVLHLEALLVPEEGAGGLAVREEGGATVGQTGVEEQDLGAAGHLLQGVPHPRVLVQEPERDGEQIAYNLLFFYYHMTK